jgi:hypothetical protein
MSYDNALTPALAEKIIARLKAHGIEHAYWEYPGYIGITKADRPGVYYAFGTANPTWAGELTADEGTNLDAFSSTIPASSEDVTAIVQFIETSLQL